MKIVKLAAVFAAVAIASSAFCGSASAAKKDKTKAEPQSYSASTVLSYDIYRLKRDYNITTEGTDRAAGEIAKEISDNLYALAEETDKESIKRSLKSAAERFQVFSCFLDDLGNIDVPMLMVYPARPEPMCALRFDGENYYFAEYEMPFEEKVKIEYWKALGLGRTIKIQLMEDEKKAPLTNRSWIVSRLADMIVDSAELIGPDMIPQVYED